jgi:hypothetical protein
MTKMAHVFPVRTADAHCFAWRWRGSDGAREASSSFVYFYDCVEDARRAGYAVDLVTPANGSYANSHREPSNA